MPTTSSRHVTCKCTVHSDKWHITADNDSDKRQTRPLAREGAPQWQDSNYTSWAPRQSDWLTDRQSQCDFDFGKTHHSSFLLPQSPFSSPSITDRIPHAAYSSTLMMEAAGSFKMLVFMKLYVTSQKTVIWMYGVWREAEKTSSSGRCVQGLLSGWTVNHKPYSAAHHSVAWVRRRELYRPSDRRLSAKLVPTLAE
jgi:hypothetical protein